MREQTEIRLEEVNISERQDIDTLIQAAYDIQHCGLAAARRTQDHAKLTRREAYIDVLQRRRLSPVRRGIYFGRLL